MVTGEESLVKSTEASCDSRVAEELSALKDWMEYTRSEKMNADQIAGRADRLENEIRETMEAEKQPDRLDLHVYHTHPIC